MKNATAADVKKAQETGKLEENVMYRDSVGGYVHGKKMSAGVDQCVKDQFGDKWTIAERADGMLWLVNTSIIRPILPKGPAQTPRRPRRTPVKGTRPERKIPVGAGTALKVGDVVELVDKNRRKIQGITKGAARFLFKFDSGYRTIRENIKYIILPYKEEEKKPVTYRIGQRFVRKGTESVFMLVQTVAYCVSLVQIEGEAADCGNRWNNPLKVQNVLAITEEEFEQITYGSPDAFFLKQD